MPQRPERVAAVVAVAHKSGDELSLDVTAQERAGAEAIWRAAFSINASSGMPSSIVATRSASAIWAALTDGTPRATGSASSVIAARAGRP